jgi:hypothetical protein
MPKKNGLRLKDADNALELVGGLSGPLAKSYKMLMQDSARPLNENTRSKSFMELAESTT